MAKVAIALALALSMGFLGVVCTPAHAQGPQCASSEDTAKLLTERYNEHPVGVGVTNSGALLVVWAGPSGSWSIVVHTPSGAACIVSSGEGWRSIEAAGPGQES